MKIQNETLILRIELITLGPDQILLGLVIAWFARFVVKIPTEIYYVNSNENDEIEISNFGGIRLFLKSGIYNSKNEVLDSLKLPEVARLLNDPLNDLTIVACGPERLEFFRDCEEIKKNSLQLRDENEDLSKFDPNESERFRDEVSRFQKKYLAKIDIRLRPLFIEEKR